MSEHKEFDQLIYEILCEINNKIPSQKLWDSGPNNYDMQDEVDLTKAPLKAYSEKEIADIKREAMIRFGEWVIDNLYIEEDGKNDRLLSAVMGRLTQGGDL